MADNNTEVPAETGDAKKDENMAANTDGKHTNINLMLSLFMSTFGHMSLN